MSHQDTLTRRISLLQHVPLLRDLNETDLARLIGDFHLKSYGKGETIFRQGDTSLELYIVLEGKVRVFKLSPSGDETSIVILSNHEILGEFAVIDGRPRSATAKAIVPTDLLAMTQDRFVAHMRTIPELAMGLARVLSIKLRWTAAYAEAASQYDAAARLLHILLLYNEKFGKEQEAGNGYVIDLPLNQTDLASLVGARREWVNRLLRDWRKRGLIEYKPGKIIIHDLPKVEAERDSRIEARQAKW